MAGFHHGISAQEVTQGILPMRSANTSVLGLIVTSTDADSDMYPVGTPVLLTGITQDNIDKAGTNGTLRDCLQTIRDIHNPTVVILRVSQSFEADSLDILLTCPARFGLMPKRFGAPEIDTPDVVLKLVSIAKRRRGIVYASPRQPDGTLITDKSAIVAYRDNYGDRELCIIDGEWGVPENLGTHPISTLNYINITEPPMMVSSIRFEEGYNVAACLKTQINDSVPQVGSFVVDPSVLTFPEVTADQVALSFLLQPFAAGDFPWGYHLTPLPAPPTSYTFLGGVVTPDMDNSVGEMPSSCAFAGFDTALLRAGLKDTLRVLDPFINDSIDSLPVGELQSFVNANLPEPITSVTITDKPSKLTISRCTQAEIDGLFVGDHLPHVDMFDAAKSLLTSQHAELNARGFEPAKYVADKDVIELTSNYSIVMELAPPAPM